MSLWSNTDANTSVPKFAPSTVKLENTQDNSNLMYANTTADAFITGATIGVFGVSPEETFGTGNVGTLTIVTAGTGFTVRPTLTITGANTTQATALANGTVVSATITAAGTGYAVGNTFTATGGTGTSAVLTITTVDGNGNVTAVSITTAGDYTALPTLTNNPFTSNTGSGTGFTANLAIGVGSTQITAAGEAYEANSVAVTVGGSGGTGASVTAGLTGQDATNKGAHAGWVLRTVGSGGRAGRVNVETLVAMGSISDDGNDDTVVAP